MKHIKMHKRLIKLHQNLEYNNSNFNQNLT